MMLQYKRSSRSQKQTGPPPGCQQTARFLPLLPKLQPKRISFGSLAEATGDSDSVGSASSMSTIDFRPGDDASFPVSLDPSWFVTRKPTKAAPPPELCFEAEGANRRLAFVPEDQELLLEAAPEPMSPTTTNTPRAYRSSTSPTTTTTTAPLVTPDSAAPAPTLPCAIVAPRIPERLCLPQTTEQEAASILVHIKNSKERVASWTPPKPKPEKKKTKDQSRRRSRAEMEHDEPTTITVTIVEPPSPNKKPKTAATKRTARAVVPTSLLWNATAPISTTPQRGTRAVPEPSAIPEAFPARLALPGDSEELNSLHCFVREELLEVFAMQTPSTGAFGGGGKTSEAGCPAPRVGLRCVHCGHRSRKEKEGASMSIFFPKSLQDIYRGVCTWQRIHFKVCKHIPPEVKERYEYFKDTDRTRGKKPYWISTAHRLGLRNVNDQRGGIFWAGHRRA